METPLTQKEWAASVAEQNSEETEVYNRGNRLPFGMVETKTTEGKVFWLCDRDREEKIISCFYNTEMDQDDPASKQIQVLPNMKEAIRFREELIKAGWVKLKSPERKFRSDGNFIEMNRKNKKRLQGIMKREAMKHPGIRDEMKNM
jgi:hypothetical protein